MYPGVTPCWLLFCSFVYSLNLPGSCPLIFRTKASVEVPRNENISRSSAFMPICPDSGFLIWNVYFLTPTPSYPDFYLYQPQFESHVRLLVMATDPPVFAARCPSKRGTFPGSLGSALTPGFTSCHLFSCGICGDVLEGNIRASESWLLNIQEFYKPLVKPLEAWNKSWWECFHHGSWQMLHKSGLPPHSRSSFTSTPQHLGIQAKIRKIKTYLLNTDHQKILFLRILRKCTLKSFREKNTPTGKQKFSKGNKTAQHRWVDKLDFIKT